jgi:hypothetical protein
MALRFGLENFMPWFQVVVEFRVVGGAIKALFSE